MRLDQARALNARLRELMIERRRNLAAIAEQLARMRRGRLFAVLGYASLAAYARAELGLGRSKVSELVGIVQGAATLPQVRDAFLRGRLEWTKARELVKLATPETEADWLARASELTAQELRAVRTGEPPRQTRVLALNPEETAEFDQLVAQVRDELGAVSDGEAVLELMRRGAGAARGDGPAKRTVITLCGACQQATSETREGSVPVRASAVEAALCDGEVHDLRDAENLITRTIPAKVRRRVLDRDRGRCRVPGCRFMSGLEVHHEDGWRAGHDPERMVTLCGRHHRARHDGELRIEGLGGGEFRFLLLDGSVLGERSVFACENTASASQDSGRAEVDTRGGEPARPIAVANTPPLPQRGDDLRGATEQGVATRSAVESRPAAEPVVLEQVTQGLQRLGLSYREARRRAQAAVDSGARGVADVFRESLHGMPRPG